MEAHSPRIIGSATEGGAELFSIDYFEQKAYLAQSPQLYKEELTLKLRESLRSRTLLPSRRIPHKTPPKRIHLSRR